jgi:hypothetical protein
MDRNAIGCDYNLAGPGIFRSLWGHIFLHDGSSTNEVARVQIINRPVRIYAYKRPSPSLIS